MPLNALILTSTPHCHAPLLPILLRMIEVNLLYVDMHIFLSQKSAATTDRQENGQMLNPLGSPKPLAVHYLAILLKSLHVLLLLCIRGLYEAVAEMFPVYDFKTEEYTNKGKVNYLPTPSEQDE